MPWDAPTHWPDVSQQSFGEVFARKEHYPTKGASRCRGDRNTQS